VNGLPNYNIKFAVSDDIRVATWW